MSTLWAFVSTAHHGELKTVLESKDVSKVEKCLNSFAAKDGLWGIDNPTLVDWSSEAMRVLVQNLAQQIGILPIPNPEQPFIGCEVIDAVVTREAIEKTIGISLDVPECFGMAGNGVSFKMLYYCAAVNRKVLGDVLEIGAGTGLLGLILWRQKIARSYTIIDLPMVAILSAWFLSKVCGEDKVWLFGEPENEGAFARFFPSTNFHGASGIYQMIFNMDSWPELPEEVQQEYLTLIGDCLTPEGAFLSVNHESNRDGQIRLFDSISKHGGFQLVSRGPFMMRAGYIEEIYIVKPHGPL